MSSKLSAQRTNVIVFIILGLFPLVGMGIDLIAPSLPTISHSLQVSNTLSKNLITIYLVGFALNNFFVGFLSDAWGRRKLAVSGLALSVVASLLPTIFPNIYILLLARLLQGMGIAAFGVLSRAIFTDILAPEKLARIAARIAMMWGIGPIIGPVIGGYLQYYFNWQACFYFYALFSFVGFVALFFFLPETHANPRPLNLKKIKTDFKSIITHRLFMGLVIKMGLSYSLLIVFSTLGPFFIQTELGHSSIYFGHVALCLGLVFLAGTFACRHLIERFQQEKILLFALIVFLLIAGVGLFAALLDNQSIWILLITSLFMFFACGIIYPTAMGKNLVLFRHLSGSGAAVMSLINILISSLTAFGTSFVHATSSISIIALYFGIMLLIGVCYWLFISKEILHGASTNSTRHQKSLEK